MHSRINLKMKDASWLKRTLYLWALTVGEKLRQAKASGGASAVLRFQAWLSDLAIYRPLQERLGLRRVRFAVSGAAPISPDLIGWFHSIGIQIAEGYGQTESTGVSHCNRPENIRIGTVGQIMPGMECRIAEDGEILLRGQRSFAATFTTTLQPKIRLIPRDGFIPAILVPKIPTAFFPSRGVKRKSSSLQVVRTFPGAAREYVEAK